MRTNGFLYIQQISNGEVEKVEFDTNGVPVDTSTPDWSMPIPCSIKTNTHNNKGVYQDGKFTMAAYEILIEDMVIDAKRVKLELNGMAVGEFVVQDIQSLQSVGRVKILV